MTATTPTTTLVTIQPGSHFDGFEHFGERYSRRSTAMADFSTSTGTGLPRLDTSRLRATWLARMC